MTAPKLVLARANGQSTVRVLFDQGMRQLGDTDPRDAQNPAVWRLNAGTIKAVERLSSAEYELVLAEPLPLATGYSVSVTSTVESDVGTAIDPTALTVPFDVTRADLHLLAQSWNVHDELDLVFSEALATIEYDDVSDVAKVASPADARALTVIGVEQMGATLRLLFDAAGTAGAPYTLTLTREVVQSAATGVVVNVEDAVHTAWGQGAPPALTSPIATETLFQVSSTEVLVNDTWPLRRGLYTTDRGDLGSTVMLGSTPAVLRFQNAHLTEGSTVTFSVQKTERTVQSGVSFQAQSVATVGAGSEALVEASTVLTKAAGSPYELVFAGGTDSLTQAGRQLTTTLAMTFPVSNEAYPLLAFTWLNTQVSVVIMKTADSLGVLRLYKGASRASPDSEPFDPSVPFALTVVDATAEGGYLSVLRDGVVVLGASSTLADKRLNDPTAGVTALALILGAPSSAAQTFEVAFHAPLHVQAYYATGLLGSESKDLLAFDSSSTSTVVSASATPVLSSGFANTGKAAFAVHAEYREGLDAVQVVIGLNRAMLAYQYAGSITLLASDDTPVDQVLFTQDNVLIDADPTTDPEIAAVFLHPRQWLGILASVQLTLEGESYVAKVPVAHLQAPSITAHLVQQPASWYHPRFMSQQLTSGAETFGPSAVTGT